MKIKNKGFTLIEIIVSIALIAILGISLLTMFTVGFKSIIGAGNKNITVYKEQAETEEKLKSKPSSGNISNKFLKISFEDSTYIEVEGKIETQSKITVFNPIN